MRYLIIFVIFLVSCSAIVDESGKEEVFTDVGSDSDSDVDNSDVDTDTDSDTDTEKDSETETETEEDSDSNTETEWESDSESGSEIEEEELCQEDIEGIYLVDDYNYLKRFYIDKKSFGLIGEIDCVKDSVVESIAMSQDGFIYALITKDDVCQGVFKVDRRTAECVDKTEFMCMSELNTFSFTFYVSEDFTEESVYLSTGLTDESRSSELYNLSSDFVEVEKVSFLYNSVDLMSAPGELYAFSDRLEEMRLALYEVDVNSGKVDIYKKFQHGSGGLLRKLSVVYNDVFYIYMESYGNMIEVDEIFGHLDHIVPTIFNVVDMTASPC